MTNLNFFERLVVVDVFRLIIKVNDDLGMPIGQEAIDRVLRIVAFVINEMIDELTERKPGDVSFKDQGVS